MSFFGKNIKKIRGVKGLSQQAFAELFGLKRATLGAYEEGRSEPKIETIIKIANYFSIIIDDLLTAELTVNQLLQFKGSLTLEVEKFEKEKMTDIPIITNKNQNDYIKYFDKPKFIKDLPVVSLPITTELELRAFTVNNLEMTSNENGVYPNDFVVGEKYPVKKLNSLKAENLMLVLVEEELVLRHATIEGKELVLKAAHKNIEDKKFLLSEVKELWLVKSTFLRRVPEFRNPFEDKLYFLEREFSKLKNK
ncbi:DNA-binding transcriptional regulator, XRE-family HTH domain [Tenacibaculum sp. MAR_2009_124]|uniref:helix-turn-helix domain-containing protein n=1 Tax=Tenacibaculum sp. MAR_2009_124 TaxID=1250059 RepID=UPI000897502E|nr:helix-turn-helix transcriptional regulator [Tenacibaculum sp. MAR_2009_124]SEC89035.1 DNA-binding transcriptional regulator, XRE-family HTH domain [Tenacibaculum sp. MAR_2009_124]